MAKVKGAKPVARKVKVSTVVKKPAVKKAVKKPAVKKAVATVATPCTAVVVNGRSLELPKDMSEEQALEEVMVAVPCEKLDKVFVKTTLLEVAHRTPPQVFFNGVQMNYAVAYDELLKTYWRGSTVRWD